MYEVEVPLLMAAGLLVVESSALANEAAIYAYALLVIVFCSCFPSRTWK